MIVRQAANVLEVFEYFARTKKAHDPVEAELRVSIDRDYCESFADYSRDLAGVAILLPIGDRRLSVVVAGPEFRIGNKTREISVIIKKLAEPHRPVSR
jgi:hypothetical protein